MEGMTMGESQVIGSVSHTLLDVSPLIQVHLGLVSFMCNASFTPLFNQFCFLSRTSGFTLVRILFIILQDLKTNLILSCLQAHLMLSLSPLT